MLSCRGFGQELLEGATSQPVPAGGVRRVRGSWSVVCTAERVSQLLQPLLSTHQLSATGPSPRGKMLCVPRPWRRHGEAAGTCRCRRALLHQREQPLSCTEVYWTKCAHIAIKSKSAFWVLAITYTTDKQSMRSCVFCAGLKLHHSGCGECCSQRFR